MKVCMGSVRKKHIFALVSALFLAGCTDFTKSPEAKVVFSTFQPVVDELNSIRTRTGSYPTNAREFFTGRDWKYYDILPGGDAVTYIVVPKEYPERRKYVVYAVSDDYSVASLGLFIENYNCTWTTYNSKWVCRDGHLLN